MRVIQISKGQGNGFRTIYVPNPEQMKSLRGMIPTLEKAMIEADKEDVQHGFRPGRSPVTNAKQHVGFAYTVSMDLQDFFDSVAIEIFGTNPQAYLGNQNISECFPDGAARQGLPTSPLLANIAASPMDSDIVALSGQSGRFNIRFVYTRYADDLTFSFNDERLIHVLLNSVPPIIAKHGFKLNPRKTKVQCAKAGRRIITGIAVDDKGIYPTRYMKRRLRAAAHQRHTSEARGLKEWILLRPPARFMKKEKRRRIQLAPDSDTGAPIKINKDSGPPTVGRKMNLELGE